MTLLWDHYWPALAMAMVIGLIAGTLAYAPGRRPLRPLLAGGAISLALAAAWHGPLGAGDRLGARIDRIAAAELKYLEMTQVRARLERRPLTRRLVLSGPADEFQHRELARIMGELPGVSEVRWSNPPKRMESAR